MRKTTYSILFLILVLLAVGCANTNSNVKNEPRPADTLYTAEAAMKVFAYDPERALAIIDSGLLVGSIEENEAKLIRAKVYSQSLIEKQQDTAQQILMALLESDYAKDPADREIVLDLLYNIALNRQQGEQQLRWATLKADCCREQGRETEALRTEAEMGYLLANLGEVEKGLAKLSGVIATLDGQRRTDEMDACIIAIKRKIVILRQQQRDKEVIPLAQHIIEIVEDYRQHYTEYTDNSYRLPHDEEQTQRYCDFYAAQAQGFLARAYGNLGDMETARHYVDLFVQSDYGKTLSGRSMIARTWCLLGEYDKMVATYDEMTAKMVGDTLNGEYAEMLCGYAQAAEAAGDLKASIDYWQRYAEMNRLLNERLLASRAYEYATRYQLQEERLNTEREQAKAQNNRNLAVAGLILALVAAGFIVWLLIQHRAIKRKNHVLVEQIAEAVKYKNRSEELGVRSEELGVRS